MIHFVCRYCGGPVRVPSAHAGRKGRCPSCKRVVEIPLEDEGVPPPPSVREEEDGEDLDLSPDAPGDEDHIGDTDILPSPLGPPKGVGRPRGTGGVIRAGKSEKRGAQRPAGGTKANKAVLAVVVIVLLAALALGLWLALS